MQCGILYILSAVVVLHVGVHNYLEFSIVQKESVAVMLDCTLTVQTALCLLENLDCYSSRDTDKFIIFLFIIIFFTNCKFLLSYFKYKLKTNNQNYYTVASRFGQQHE